MDIRPLPTDEEVAAIMAAYSELWPRPVATTDAGAPDTRWRFATRWWHAEWNR